MTTQSVSLRKTNFDLVRLILAWMIALKHCYDLSGDNPALWPIHKGINGYLGTEGFFAVSGFLIFAEYERCKSVWDFALNRALRILPAYWLAALACLMIAFSTGHFHVGKFLVANLAFASFKAPDIAGVFANNPMTPMNGALWVFKVFILFYITVPVIVWLCRKLNRDLVLGAIFVLSVAFRLAFASHEKISIQYPGQASFFMLGALIYYHLDFFIARGKWIVLLGAVAYGANMLTGWFIFRPIGVPCLVLGAALLLPQFKGPAKFGDFSYGSFLLHWPVIQLVVAAGLFATQPWLGVLAVILILSVAAAISWFAVEKPILSRSPSAWMREEALEDEPYYPVAVP